MRWSLFAEIRIIEMKSSNNVSVVTSLPAMLLRVYATASSVQPIAGGVVGVSAQTIARTQACCQLHAKFLQRVILFLYGVCAAALREDR